MIALLALLACGEKDPPDSPIDDSPGRDSAPTDDSQTDSQAPAYPSFANPAEAEDLDPAEGSVRFELTAAPFVQEVTDPETGEVLSFEGFAYNGQTPGPTLRGQLGDRFELTLTNDLDSPTTIHWHGLDVPFEMDGVTWMTDPIEPGEQFTYRFTLEHAGTFWYHPHFDTDRQVDNGLYGVLIVEDPAEPAADRELVMVFDDWTLPDDEAEGPPPPHGGGSDLHGVDGGEGLWTINKLVQPTLTLDGGERVRVRVLNAANSATLALTWPEMRQLAADQGLLPALRTPERVVLGAGDRAEFEWLPGEQGFELLDEPYHHSGGDAYGEPEPRMRVEIGAPASAGEALAWPFPGGEVSADPGYTDLTYVFTGELEGPWLINGEAFPEVTVQHIPRDREAILEIRNLSASEHPFHLHGMRFEVLSLNGVPPDQPQIEDTYNLAIRDALRVRVLPQREGWWMLHCHILEHADGGMMTVLEVREE
ncbi:MAG: multicopper oxidase family protein [Alphaproteobacteria bacterium]|nr:multicopper oxidase family protein [Alphaproteobacteria bacterium]